MAVAACFFFRAIFIIDPDFFASTAISICHAHPFRLFRALIDFALPWRLPCCSHPTRKDNNNRVGSPFLRSGPGMFPMRAKKDARRGLSPDLTGRFRFMPWARAERRPASFKPPWGSYLPCRQAGVLATTHRSGLASSVRAFRPSNPRQGAIYIFVTRLARQTLFSSASHQAFSSASGIDQSFPISVFLSYVSV